MSKKRLVHKLYNLDGFQENLLPVVVQSVTLQFVNINTENNEFMKKVIDWEYMLLCGSILAKSDNGEHLDVAYRIAQYCLNSLETNENQKLAATIILDSMTNASTIQLAMEKELIPTTYKENVPLTFQLEMIKRGIQYSVLDQGTNNLLYVNRFQLDAYKGAMENDWTSISAPTSGGKSFIILQMLIQYLKKQNNQVIVYIVPTRALIQQVEYDLHKALSVNKLGKVYVTSVPIFPKDMENESVVFVLTQERLQWMLLDNHEIKPSMIIVDEAQKIGDGSRGILLQQVIEEIIRRTSEAKFIFSSPMTSNPEIFLNKATSGSLKKSIVTEQVTVNQNLLWVSQVPRKPTQWNIELCLKDNRIYLGKFTMRNRPTQVSKRLPFVAFELGNKEGGNLIYANAPAEAEKCAKILWDLRGDEADTTDKEIHDLIKLIKKVINKDYVLAEILTRGIAFHYGNLPLIIKNEIERLFKNGKIKYLVCTSTLIEGMNLPAKSIFIRGPKKGIGTPMNEIDFWNLAGRAGRQGKEFQGNVICVDVTDSKLWNGEPPSIKKKYVIEPSVDMVVQNIDQLIDFIEAGTPRKEASSNPELEYGFGYFLGEHIRNDGLNNSPFLDSYEKETVKIVEKTIAESLQDIEIPKEIILKNPAVSPIAQQKLLQFFKECDEEIEQYVPLLPESDEALDQYCRIVEKISGFLSGDPAAITYPHALLVVEWMRGYSLSRIINRNWKYWKEKNKNLQTVIRDTMRDIEEYARFKFVKYSSCYIDILKYFLECNGYEEIVKDIPELSLWLEFGVSQGTQISLMSLGLTRTSAIAISEYIVDTDLTPKQCIEWLKEHNLDSLDLSPIVITEIYNILSVNAK